MIDGGCFVGRDLGSGASLPTEDLVADLDRRGVSAALVGSFRSIWQDVIEGAREVSALAERHPGRVIPVAILHPAHYGGSFDALFGRLRRDHGIRVVALLAAPSFYPIDWSVPAVREIGAAAERTGMVLQAGIRNAAELADLARAWGELTVDVLVRGLGGHRYLSLASEFAVARSCPRFLFDVGNMTSVGMIERAAAVIGADRLFFSSNAPVQIGACAHAVLRSAGLTAADRERIEGGTIGSVLGAALPEPAPASDLGRRIERLERAPKVDLHWHPDHNNLGDPSLEVADQIASFDRWAYERVIVFTNLALYHDIEAGNQLTEAWCGRDARVFGMVVVDPSRRDDSLGAIDRYASHNRFVGVKTVQEAYGMGLDDPAYEPLLERAERHGLPVLAHLTGLDEAAARHPALRFIAAHSNWRRAAHLDHRPNVMFEFSTSHSLEAESQIARFVSLVGSERILFGSDGPLVSPAWSLAKLVDIGLSSAEERAILRDNAYRVFPKLRGR